MDLSNDYDEDGNNIVPCPICDRIGCEDDHRDFFEDQAAA